MKSKEYWKGRKDCKKGKSIDDNPYFEDEKRLDWVEGYFDEEEIIDAKTHASQL